VSYTLRERAEALARFQKHPFRRCKASTKLKQSNRRNNSRSNRHESVPYHLSLSVSALMVISVISYGTAGLLIERLSLISPSLSRKRSVWKNV
jgi:Flp pilus assembly protein TadB